MVSSMRFMFSLPQTTFGSLPLFVHSFWFLVLLKLLPYLKISPDKGAAKLSSAPWVSFQEQGYKRSAAPAKLPCSFLHLISGLFDVSMVFSSYFFISLTAWATCSQKTISPSEVPGPAFSVQFCSGFRHLKNKVWTGYKTGISWKKWACLWPWCWKLHSYYYTW